MILYFVGWFKIQGHSNVKHKTLNKNRTDLIKRQKRIGRITPRGISYKALKPDVNFHLSRFLRFLLISSITAYIYLNWDRFQHNSVDHMESIELHETGSIREMSKFDLNLLEATRNIHLHNYEEAHMLLVENYKLGSSKIELYQKLAFVSSELCKTNSIYCSEVNDWKEIVSRLKK